jgi:tetratricopeptide (TPR) repeat protein
MDTDAPRLIDLLGGKLDQPLCEACRSTLPTRQTLGVWFSSPPEVDFFAGDILAERGEEAIAGVTSNWTKQGIERIVRVSSPSDLRTQIVKQLRRHVAALSELQKPRSAQDFKDFLKGQWQNYTPEVFVAGLLLMMAKLGKEIAAEEGPISIPEEFDRAVADLARRQALSWVALCENWTIEGARHSFEDDLQRYLVPSALLTGSPGHFFAGADAILAQEKAVSGRLRFTLEAVRATLCSFTRQENRNASQWTEFLVAHEMALSTSTDKDEALRRLRIGEERARNTAIFQGVFDAIGRRIKGATEESVHTLDKVAGRLGYPTILREIKSSGLRFSGEVTTQQALDFIGEFLVDHKSSSAAERTATVIGGLQLMEVVIPHQDKADKLCELADGAMARFGKADEMRGEVEAWLGSVLNRLREPAKFLLRLGKTIAPWEMALPAPLRISLWTERATAMRLMGEPQVARDLYEIVDELCTDDLRVADKRVSQRNLAIGYRETGAPDVALRKLNELLPYTIGEERINTLESLMVTHRALGQADRALACSEEAMRLAIGPLAGHYDRLALSHGSTLASIEGQEETAARFALGLPVPNAEAPRELFAYVTLWLNVIDVVDLTEDMFDRIEAASEALTELTEKADKRGDGQLKVQALRATAHLYELLDQPDAFRRWVDLNQTLIKLEQPLDTAALLALARFSYLHGHEKEARELALMVPDSLIPRVGSVKNIDEAAKALFDVAWFFDRLIAELAGREPPLFEDLRIALELKRDAIRRAMSSVAGQAMDTFVAPINAELGSLAGLEGDVAVLEITAFADMYAMMVTIVGSDGGIAAHLLPHGDVAFEALTTEIVNRLANWTSQMPGDPFAIEQWKKLEAWISERLSPLLPRRSHLVVLESAILVGLPWHVAVPSHWTCSYAASWSSLLTATKENRSAPTGPDVIGVALVPTFDENAEVLSALRLSDDRSRKFAAASALKFEDAVEIACDHGELSRLLQSSTILKILCHGYFSKPENEVAWMVAAGGELPLKSAHAASTAAGRRHRFSWRNIVALERGPRVVFSAACSSARAHIVGEGERLGLFAPLRSIGTRAMVAPAWDIEAKAVLPILDTTLELYAKGVGLAKALSQACLEASAAQPRWLAWSLTIEGDWR